MRIPAFIIVFLLFCPNLYCHTGKVLLKNGGIVTGEIKRLPNGGCMVIMENGSVIFDKDEINKITITSSRHISNDKFAYSFKSTPAKSSGVRTISTPYDDMIHQEAKKNNLDPALIKAVIKAESNFRPNDKSSKGACGLMQLMPVTAGILGVKSIFSPQENIRVGTRFLRDMLYTFDGDLNKALAAYNAGPTAVRRYNDIPPYAETRDYVNKVNRYYAKYKNSGKVCHYVDKSGCLNIYNVR